MTLAILDDKHSKILSFKNGKYGYTVVELMVTVIIVAILATTLGIFFVKLLRIQEQEREEAYIREKLIDFCSSYANYASVGSVFYSATNALNQLTAVKYRLETGGVSLETGIVSKVTYLASKMNVINKTIDIDIFSQGVNGEERKLSRRMSGDASLIPVPGDMISCTLTPLSSSTNGYETTDAALAWLEVAAQYEVMNDDGDKEMKTVKAGRLVRLWNKE